MTQKQFDTELRRLARRIQLLQEANSGKTKLRRVDVKKCVVPEHTRSAHTRHIAPAGWKKQHAKQPAAS